MMLRMVNVRFLELLVSELFRKKIHVLFKELGKISEFVKTGIKSNFFKAFMCTDNSSLNF